MIIRLRSHCIVSTSIACSIPPKRRSRSDECLPVSSVTQTADLLAIGAITGGRKHTLIFLPATPLSVIVEFGVREQNTSDSLWN